VTGQMSDHVITDSEPVQIRVSKKIKVLNPVAQAIAGNLARVAPIRFVRVLPDLVEASSEGGTGRTWIPITKPGHPTAIGISVILSLEHKSIQFFAITSSQKGYGGKMVDAVMQALPTDWRAFVVMDWSGGFWQHMKRKYENMEIS
jgi:hypothetical protein